MNLIKWATIAFAVITLIITIVFFSWWAFKDPIVFGKEKFDRVQWIKLEPNLKNECKRGDMAYDLQNNILFRGVKREQITVLLGRPAHEDGQLMEYDLGKCMHVYHALLIVFDKDGRLINSRISSH